MGKRNEVTIYDLAKVLNLSTSTISRALTGSRLVNQQTRAKVTNAADELGYRPNTFAQRLRSHKTHLIGAMVTRLSTTTTSSVLSGAESAAGDLGYCMIVSQSMNSPELRIKNLQRLKNHGVDGILVSSAYYQEFGLLDPLASLNVPRVVIETSALLPGITVKKISDAQNSFELTEFLIEKGCRKIGHLTIGIESTRYANIITGCREALQHHGLPEADKFVLNNNAVETSWTDICQSLKSMVPWLDGLIITSNVLTAVAYSVPSESALGGTEFWLTCRKGSLASQHRILFELGKIGSALLVGLGERHEVKRGIEMAGSVL